MKNFLHHRLLSIIFVRMAIYNLNYCFTFQTDYKRTGRRKSNWKKNLRATFSIPGTVCALFTSERGKTELNIFDWKPTPAPISPCIATGQGYFVSSMEREIAESSFPRFLIFSSLSLHLQEFVKLLIVRYFSCQVSQRKQLNSSSVSPL